MVTSLRLSITRTRVTRQIILGNIVTTLYITCMTKPLFHVVLYQPDIHWNTGAIGRTSVALGFRLILIEPLGFSLEDRQIKRAGMDYWQHVDLDVQPSWESFTETYQPESTDMWLFSSKVERNYYSADYKEGCFLVFGSETSGLPSSFNETYKDQFVTLPQRSEKIRSLNLANTATAASYEALRQIEYI